MKWLPFLTNGRFSGFTEDVHHLVVAKDLKVDLIERQKLDAEIEERENLEADLVERVIIHCEVTTC